MRITWNRNAAALLKSPSIVGYVLRVQRIMTYWKLKSFTIGIILSSVTILQSTYYGTLQRGIDSLCVVERRCVYAAKVVLFFVFLARRIAYRAGRA